MKTTMSDASEKWLKDVIREIVEDHSGGLKFTELVSITVSKVCENNAPNERPPTTLRLLIHKDWPDILERLCREDKTLCVLDYAWKNEIAKMFVYTP
jgi:hypothetical protein